MKTNVGAVDRFIRVAIGLLLVSLAIAGAIGWWGYIGFVPLLTGLFRFCPAYRILGLSSCPRHT